MFSDNGFITNLLLRVKMKNSEKHPVSFLQRYRHPFESHCPMVCTLYRLVQQAEPLVTLWFVFLA